MLMESDGNDVKGTDPLFGPSRSQESDEEEDNDAVLPPTTSIGTLVRQLDETLPPQDWNESSGGYYDQPKDPLTDMSNTLTSYDELLAPPSYADSVFERSEIEIEQAGTEDIALGSSSAPSSSTTKPKGVLEVTVTDPVKRDDCESHLAMVGKKYIEYLVTTTTSLPGFAAGKFSVRRRFRDFVSLAEVLADSHRGYFIPQRPEKTLMEGQLSADKEFVEERRVQLEKYLNMLVAHPVLRHSAELRTFLESESGFTSSPMLQHRADAGIVSSAARLPRQLFGQEPSVPSPAEASQPPRASRDFLRVFKEIRQAVVQSSVVSAIGEAVGVIEAHHGPAEDDDFLVHKVTALLAELERHLSEASRKAEQLVVKHQAHGDVLGEMGMALIKLANHQDNEGARRGQYTEDGATLCGMADDVRRSGRACVRLARLARAAGAQTVQQLGPLHQYLGLNAAVRRALSDRTQALLTAQTLEAEAKHKRARLAKLDEAKTRVFGGDKQHQKKVEDLQKELEACEASARASMAEYGRIRGRNAEEWERLQVERQTDLSGMVSGFARVEAAFHERAASIWLEVAREFGADGDTAQTTQG
mmetsp:Transcript_37299/g.81235  ORF Transcript_37299/g.81235 Transcript_37299/m.81235 type:complete len:588 (-) Transcript_37299:343-2106(-)